MAQSRSLPLFAAAIVVAIVLACSGSDTHEGSTGQGVNVQLAWQTAREVSGHQVHVVEQGVECVKCHELTAKGVGTASPARCSACHEQEGRIHHAEREAQKRFGHDAKADCTSCHAFTAPKLAAQTVEGRTSHAEFSPEDCARCHAQKQGETPAVVVHGSSDCVSCHEPHQDAAPRPGPCVDCHREISTNHAAVGKSPMQVCTTCHQHQHAPAAEAVGTCQTCHATQQPIVPKTALFADGHSECISCHRPHDFGKQATEPCRSCHAEIHVLGAPGVAAHNQCTSCHRPHDVRGSPEKACANCHAGVHPDHPKVGPGAGCVGCHDPHPRGATASTTNAHASAKTCSGCHETAHADTAFHAGVSCTQCHKPHAFALAKGDLKLCSGCHAQETGRVAGHSGHQACTGCHQGLPHHPGKAGPGNCEACHAREAHEAHQGHQACTNCHEPHSGAQTKTCNGCHEPEAHTAPAGHTQCVNCHQPHSGAPAKAACSTCHAKETQSKHGQLAGTCTNCHRPHGPGGVASPPACATCHKPGSLGGLHQVAKHQECTNCHSGHSDKPAIARDACLTCHADRKTHFPNAARCASCHLFD